MRPIHWLAVVRALCLVAIATSAALLVDYVSPAPAFCSPNSGCGAVRHSGFGYWMGVPVPALGLAGFGFLYFLSLSKQHRVWVRPVAYAGAAMALVFIGIMAFVIHHSCLFCVVTDASAILAAGAAYLSRERTKKDREEELLASWAWVTLAVIAITAPVLWPKLQPRAPVPAGIQQYYKPGKINVIEFADYECPFCRKLHPTLKKLVGEYGDRVNFVRLNMPLPRHTEAMFAAKAAICAAAQGKEEAATDALFEASDLSEANVRRIVLGLGVEPKKFDACVTARETAERIARESQILRDAGFQGLPTTYVGSRQIVGAYGEDVFREAFDQAAQGKEERGIPAWLYFGLSLLLAGAVAHFGRLRHEPATERPERASKPPPKKRSGKRKDRAKETDPADEEDTD